MKAHEMFAQFLQENEIDEAVYDTFAFGADADGLAQLVLQGKKTACASVYELYLYEESAPPRAGQFSVILNSRDEAVCVIRTTLVYVCDFEKVAPLHAAKEGEGDGSLAYWREQHEEFFTRELNSIGLSFSRKTPVVCEEFELVYPKKEETE